MKKYSLGGTPVIVCHVVSEGKGGGGAIEPQYHGLNRVLRYTNLAVRYKGEAIAFLEHGSMVPWKRAKPHNRRHTASHENVLCGGGRGGRQVERGLYANVSYARCQTRQRSER